MKLKYYAFGQPVTILHDDNFLKLQWDSLQQPPFLRLSDDDGQASDTVILLRGPVRAVSFSPSDAYFLIIYAR